MSEDGNVAVFVGTMLQTGDAVALCDQCMVPWAAAVLQSMTGVDPTPFLLAVSEDQPSVEEVAAAEAEHAEQAAADEEAAARVRKNGGRTRAGSREAGTDADPSDPEGTANDDPLAATS